jgi:hypothetical protein
VLFESELEEQVLLAFFVPGIVYMADAVGTQTEALVIRGLSVGVSIRRIMQRELVTGVLVGVILAIAFFAVGFRLGRVRRRTRGGSRIDGCVLHCDAGGDGPTGNVGSPRARPSIGKRAARYRNSRPALAAHLLPGGVRAGDVVSTRGYRLVDR